MSDLLKPLEVSEMLGVTMATLRNWRKKGIGPPHVQLGGQARYSQEGIVAWLENQSSKKDSTQMTIQEKRAAERQIQEGRKFITAFGIWGAMKFAQGLSFQQAKQEWNKLRQPEEDRLALKIGRAAARFAASMKLKKQLDTELEDKI